MDPKPAIFTDAVVDHVVKWVHRFGITWCTGGVLVYVWRGSVPWVAYYLFWFAVTIWSNRRLHRARDDYLLAKADLEYQRERLEGEQ